MKRLMPSSLISFLQANPACTRADLFKILLPTGTTMYVTDGQFDITVPSGTNGWTGGTTTFLASTYGRWTRGAVTSQADYQLSTNTMSLICVPQQGTAYPGMTVGILNAAFNGLFESAKVTVYTAYMPSNGYGNVSNGIETKWYGTIESNKSINRLKVEFECADPLYSLSLKVPTRVFQADCPWSYGDSNCSPVGGIQTQTFTAAGGSTAWTLIPAIAFGQAAGFFTQGVIKCTIGANAGLSQTVKLHDGTGHLTMAMQWLLTPAVGDTFIVTAGCSKTLSTCTTKFANQSHFGGFISIPPVTQAV